MTGVESELRRVLHDDRLALPVPADPVARITTGVARRRRRRAMTMAAGAAVLAVAAAGTALAVRVPSHDGRHTGMVTLADTPVAIPTNLARRDPRDARRPCALNDLNPAPWTERSGRTITLLVTNSSDTRCTLTGSAVVIATEPGSGNRGPVGSKPGQRVGAPDRQYPATIDPGEPARIDVASDPACTVTGTSLRDVAVVQAGREYPLAGFQPSAACPLSISDWYVQPPLINAPLDVTVTAPERARPGDTVEYRVAVANAFGRAFPLRPCPVYIQQIGSAPAAAYRLSCKVSSVGPHSTVWYPMRIAIDATVPAGPAKLIWTMVLGDGRVAIGSRNIQISR